MFNNLINNLFKISAVILFIGISPVYANDNDIEEIQQNMRLFSDTFVLIKENYVSTTSVKALTYGALKGMVNTLDPYSQFMEPEVAEIVKSDTEGEFGGLGIRITQKDDYVTVVTPLPDTPAYRLGIMPGDKIVKIEGEDAKGLLLRDAVKKLRGAKGTKVNITIAREGEADLLEFTITRDIIVPKKVYVKDLEDNIGYVRLVEFTDDAPGKLKKALKKHVDNNIEGLILDLRNNPGGLLSAAVEIADFFVEKGKMIVYTKGRREDQNREFHATNDPLIPDLPMVVLINKGSASASEIVSGCLKDYARAVIVGETSFGKASVQSIIDLEDKSSLRLTTAKYYTPSGKIIHEKGVDPDVFISISKEERVKLSDQDEEILNLSKEEKEKRASERIKDPQLERAKEVLRIRKVFLNKIDVKESKAEKAAEKENKSKKE